MANLNNSTLMLLNNFVAAHTISSNNNNDDYIDFSTSSSFATSNSNSNSNPNTTFSAIKNDTEFLEFYGEIQSLVSIIVPICFGIIAVTGFFGNTLVILVVLLNQQMHSTTNLLIVNLAIADLLFVVFCVPFTAADYVTDIWPFGDLWCRIVQYLIVVTAFTSIYTLVLMSIDRFLAVVHPIRSRMLRTEKITKIAIFTLWTVILIISLPVPMAHGVLVSRNISGGQRN
ncbi:allatostatin-A receptor-like [Teleopsis dalmanni]|uniref:allatostatin-A receptor-like n=1 Tax=Teleopsis dalmanni TaxID=139649 RepID=UPI0018CF7E50|nr:allatostatin-A receptor-like [Teleopsis dalmanni]